MHCGTPSPADCLRALRPKIIAIVFLVFLILYHAQAVGTIIVSVISMVFLLIIATVGLVAVIKKSRTLCLYVRLLGHPPRAFLR